MVIDLFLPTTISKIKQLLSDRRFLRNVAQEVQALHESSYLTIASASAQANTSSDIVVLSDDRHTLEINVLSASSGEHTLDISVLTPEQPLPSDSDESQRRDFFSNAAQELDIEVLSESAILDQPEIEVYNDASNTPVTGEVVTVLESSSDSGERVTRHQQIENNFDENWAEARLQQVRSEVNHIKQQITDLIRSKNQRTTAFSNESGLFEQQHLENLRQYDQQTQAARHELTRQANIQRQITQDQAQLQEAQRRRERHKKLRLGVIVVFMLVIGIGLTASLFLLTELGLYLSLWGIGIWIVVIIVTGILYYVLVANIDHNTNEVHLLASTELPIASHLQQLRAQREQKEYRYQQQKRIRQETFQIQQQNISDQLVNMYERAANSLIPEGEGIITSWLNYLAITLQKLYPDWDDPYWQEIDTDSLIQLQNTETRGLRIGTLVHEDLSEPIPAIISPIQDHKHIFITGGDDEQRGRNLQAAILRLLTVFPVNIVKVTIIDPVDLGHHVLASLATKLPEQISRGSVKYLEQDITAALEQLRDTVVHTNHYVLVEHPDISSYNQAHPEVPTPFHFVLIHNFPDRFTAQALKVIQDILRKGPRVGIYVLATIADPLPEIGDFDISAFTGNSFTLRLQNDGFLHCNDSLLEGFVIRQDSAVRSATFLQILNTIQEAYEKNPLVLRYERIKKDLPPLWSLPTSDGLQSIAGLTFSGAVHKIEFNDEFVSGLIGGRPGSGKTILLHNLICGLAQSHAPDEVELFLLDFAGTELNVYARHHLPHARVIAVDCDPEIGLSVINDLINQMEARIKRFSDADVSSFREYRKKFLLPRILLVIDEIHVLTQYSDDVRLTNQVSNKLVDLLKRGRKYGIHVLLATQSPSNVLSKEMLQQVAIRVCLLADSSVSRLVLGEANEAASRLEKQGEAVYNAYNGDPKKNEFIRVALMERDYIAPLVQSLAVESHNQGIQTKELFYFDGQRRIALPDTPLIQESLNSRVEPVFDGQIVTPLGESINSLGHYTVAEFRRQRYSNMVIVSEEMEQLYAIWCNILMALCVQQACHSVRFYVVDLSASGLSFVNVTSVFQEVMPHEFQIAQQALIATEFITDLHTELGRRKEEAQQGFAPEQTIFLLIFGIENLSSLRGASKFDKTETRKQFEEILKEGPPLGIHTVAATQTLARGEIVDVNEFTFRVCFSVGETDSRSLLDTDAATKLRRSDRGIFRHHTWQVGLVDKFKPYLPVTDRDMREIAKRLVDRVDEAGS